MDMDYNAAILGGDQLEEIRKRIAAGLPIVSLRNGAAAQPAPAPAATAAPSTPVVSMTAQPKPYEPGTRQYDLTMGATTQPTMPGAKNVDTTPPAGMERPPVSLLGGSLPPTRAAEPVRPVVSLLGPNGSSVGPQASAGSPSQPQQHTLEEEYRELLRSEPSRDQFPAQKMSLGKKLLGILASTAAGVGGGGNVAGETARRFFSAPERKAEQQFETAHGDWENRGANLLRLAKLRDEDLKNANTQSETDARDRKENPNDKKVDEGYNAKGQRVHVYQRADGTEYTKVFPDITREERQAHSSPFEAFAYGTPEEKKAAQDFLDMEKRLESRYRNPSEFEEKYRLYRENPDAYRAMFGDKGSEKPDTATATRMLSYFDKRRREVQQDFTLDDAQKQEQLQEIERLEKPFMDAVQPGAAGARAGNNDRVEVIHPDGRRGSIPRSQLQAAKKKGYREASPQ